MMSRRVILVLFVFLVVLCPRMSESDLITYLRFEEGAGTTAADQTGLMDGDLMYFNEFTGWSTDVPSSIVPLTGQANTRSLYFGPGFVDLSNFNDVNLGTNFTVEFYFKADDLVLQSLYFSLTPSSSLMMALAEDPETEDIYYAVGLQGTLYLSPTTDTVLSAWHHLALVKEPGDFQLYLDGNLVTMESVPVSEDGPYFFPGTGMTGDRTIGGDSGTWRGWLDEFRISDEALSPDQFLNAVPEPGTWLLLLSGLSFLSSKFTSIRRQKR